jgi:hypothetical protein
VASISAARQARRLHHHPGPQAVDRITFCIYFSAELSACGSARLAIRNADPPPACRWQQASAAKPCEPGVNTVTSDCPVADLRWPAL